jgi:hypothetical protein
MAAEESVHLSLDLKSGQVLLLLIEVLTGKKKQPTTNTDVSTQVQRKHR